MSQPAIQFERFLYPSASVVGGEQLANPTFDADVTGWTARSGGGALPTLSHNTSNPRRGAGCLEMLKNSNDLGAGTANLSGIYARVTPPRGLVIPALTATGLGYNRVGPAGALAASYAINTDTTITLADARNFPDSGTAVFFDRRAPFRAEVSWNGKSGNILQNVVGYIRNENALGAQTFRAPESLERTAVIRRLLLQAWVQAKDAGFDGGGANQQVRLEIALRYTGAGGGYTGAQVTGAFVALPVNAWVLLELEMDAEEKNVSDPAWPGNEIEVRIDGHWDNNLNTTLRVDEARVYHMLELSTRVTQGPPSPIRDAGLTFERTAGGVLRGGRIRPAVTRHSLTWDQQSPIPADLRDKLVAWHRYVAHPDGDMRSFDYQHVQHARGNYRHPQSEVVWAAGAPVFQEVGLGELWQGAIPLEYVTEASTL